MVNNYSLFSKLRLFTKINEIRQILIIVGVVEYLVFWHNLGFHLTSILGGAEDLVKHGRCRYWSWAVLVGEDVGGRLQNIKGHRFKP